ncbi:MAG: PQQ-like beta-propeller repeat protein [Planctomycetaceae bacterium]|nr:PQQ-like beta-propeller repeat protein [Planctomycetaceae bacterium]
MLSRISCLFALLLFCLSCNAQVSETGITVTLGVASDTANITGSSWTIFNGPNRDSVSPETGLLKPWKEVGPPLLWKAVGIGSTEFPGYSSVSVGGGRVYTSGNIRTGATNDNAHAYIFALDEKTGGEIWRYQNGPAWTERGNFPGERGTPTIDGDRVYAYSAIGRIACLEATTGKEIWTKDLRAEYDATLPRWAFAESPYIDGNKVIIWIGGKKAAVVALDKMTGSQVWATPSTDMHGAYASMIAFDYGGQRIYANAYQKGVLGVNAETGAKLFVIPHETMYDVLATTPYFFDGKLFITSGYGTGAKVHRLNVSGNTITPELVWENKNFDNQHGGVVIKDGYAYTSTHNYRGGRNWMCFKLEDGSVAWENPGVFMGSIAYADGMLYCYGEKEGEVALVKATPEKYEEISRFGLPEGVGMYWAHPVIVNKKLFLRHGNTLYCFDIAAR